MDSTRGLMARLLKENRPFIPIPLCAHFRINPSIIRGGVLCSECHAKLIRKTGRVWICSDCGKLIKSPYADNLKDWFFSLEIVLQQRNVVIF